MADALHTGTGIDANTLGKYRLIAGLGRGGMAAVHLAVVHGPASFNKLVVIKQIHDQYAEDPEVLGMFLDEAKLAARLSHPNVVQTNEVGEEGTRHFLAMEYLDGQPLNRITQRLGKRGALPLALHLQVIIDLLGGLHYAHELCDYDGTPLGVVHRDITPQNIFVTYDGVVKIVDFGIAKARHAVTETRVGIIKGKIAYMAPEQARSEEVDRRADIFAVGVMLWEAATGTRPWKGVTEISLLKNLLTENFPSVRSIKPDVPEELEAIIVKALSRDREDRHATAADLQAELEAYLAKTGERPQQRVLGKLLSHHFAAERAEIKRVIESQLQSHAGVARDTAPSLPIIEHITTPDAEVPGRRTDSSPSLLSEPGSSPGPTGRSSFAASFPVAAGGGVRPRRHALAWAGVLLAGAALIAALGLSRRSSAPLEAAAATPPVSTAIDAASAPATVGLRVSASPKEARVFLDDEPLQGNPFVGQVRRDDVLHRMRVEAPGFVTHTERIALDKDRDFAIALGVGEPVALDAPPAASGPMPGSPRSSNHLVGKPRNLDGRNPYPGH